MTLISERRPSTAPEFPIGRADRCKGSNWALATITLVLFLTFLDNTIVSVVLANVQSALHAGVSALQWHGGDRSSATMAKGRLNARRPHTVIDLRQESLSADGLGYWARDSRTMVDGRWLR